MDAFKAWVCSSECKIPAGAGWDDLNVKLAEAAWLAAIASERERWRALLEARAAGCELAAENTEDSKFDAMARVLMSVRDDGSKA